MFRTTVDRSLRLRSDHATELPMPIDGCGFLDDAARVFDSIEAAKPGDLLTAAVAGQAQVMLILGEPGLGKSTLLCQVEADLRSQGRVVVFVDGADLTEESFDRELADVHALISSGEGESGQLTTLIVDSLDESTMISRFARRLGNFLDSVDSSLLQLVMFCRTADVPSNLLPTLRQHIEVAPLVVDLAPLRRSEAAELAGGAGVDGQGLVTAAIARGAGSMAAVPLTLELLVREYAEKGGLDAPPRELFELGIGALLEATSAAAVSSPDQRRAVAERIAATALLTGRRTVFVGRSAEATSHDLRDSEVADGFERTAVGEFPVTPQHVKETISTALFGGRGTDRVGFVHASQAAFLAAAFLARQEPPLSQTRLQSLLLVAAPDGAQSVPTSLRETAAWLAALSPAAGEWLARGDPESLVGHESYLDSPHLRSLVVESLLNHAAQFELGNRYWFRGLNLAHPGLADQIVAALGPFDRQPTDYPEFARCRVALRLAQFAESSELTERLFEIARSADWNSHLGSLAVDALLNTDGTDDDLRELLRSLDDTEYASARDGHDDLRGRLLDGLWPGRIDLPQVLRSLRPRQSDLIGSYWRFLREFPERLGDEEIEEVVCWAAELARCGDD